MLCVVWVLSVVGSRVLPVFATCQTRFLPWFLLGFCVSDFISPIFISQEVEISELLFRIQTYIINVGLKLLRLPNLGGFEIGF